MIPAALAAMLAVALLFGQNSQSAGERVNASSISSTGRPSKTARYNQGRKVTELMGKRVEDLYGEKLGVINNLVINPRSGRLEFVVLARGGFAGMGSQLRVVPSTALSQATAKVGVLALNIHPVRWRNAPNFSKNQLTSLESSTAAQRIYRYYGQPWPAVAPLTQTGSRPSRLEFARDWIGQTVLNHRRQALGAIADCFVDLKHPQTTLMILKPDGAIQSVAKELFAIPTSAFNRDGDGGNLILDANLRQFQQAQSLDGSRWLNTRPGMDSPQIYLFQSSYSLGTKSAGNEHRSKAISFRPPENSGIAIGWATAHDFKTTQTINKLNYYG